MNSVYIITITIIGYVIAYRTYGRYLARKIFGISESYKMPSEALYDGVDYVPADKKIVFGHHFTTIAGLGPIVGPAIGIIWGWLPAILWIFFGSIFMGAVHDFASLVISGRKMGKTIGDLTGDIIGPGPKFAFQFIIQFLLFIVLSVFALIVATLFMLYPQSVIPIWLQIPIAVLLGKGLHSGKKGNLFAIIAVVIMYATILLGVYIPVDLSALPLFHTLAAHGMNMTNLVTVTWCIIIFIYVYFASTVPVHKLLQPRDYINSIQLFIALALIVAGVLIAHPSITAPAINHKAFAPGSDVPNIMPILFIIIACGAISGFHSIASSGTTVKQVKNEKDTLLIGYGSMLAEGFLAVLVLVCIAGGLGLGLQRNGVLYTGRDAFYQYYSSWSSANSGIGAKLNSFIIGAANLLAYLGIPGKIGRPMIAVFIVSFANTTLDSATRMQRLSLQELLNSPKIKDRVRLVSGRYGSTLIVVLLAAIMTFIKPGGKGALILWPLFGSLNQLLAALGLAVITVYLFKAGKNFYLTLFPLLFVLFMTVWSMFENLFGFIAKGEITLSVITAIALGLTVWLLTGGIKAVFVRPMTSSV